MGHGNSTIIKEERGFAIMDVYPNAPAEELGLQSGDIIIEVNGESTYDLSVDDFLLLQQDMREHRQNFVCWATICNNHLEHLSEQLWIYKNPFALRCVCTIWVLVAECNSIGFVFEGFFRRF